MLINEVVPDWRVISCDSTMVVFTFFAVYRVCSISSASGHYACAFVCMMTVDLIDF